MTEGKKARRKEGKRTSDLLTFSPSPLPTVLLCLCLCILALRATYTESPTAQVLTGPGSLSDTVYSLTLSGLLIFAFVFWLLRGLFTGRPAYRRTGIELGLAVFVAAAVLSTCGAADKRAAITQTATLLGPIFAALLLVQLLDTTVKVRLVLAVIVALGIVSAYSCAEQRFISNAIMIEQYEKNPQFLLEPLGIEPGTFQHFLFEHRIYSQGVRGFFTTSNSAASFALMACAAAAILLIQRRRNCRTHVVAPRYVLFAALAALLVATGLFLTQSKGGIGAFCAGLLACGLVLGISRWLPGQRQRLLAALLLIALLLAAGAGYATVRYGVKHGRLPGGNSMLVRWQYWAASARMIADHGLTGVGPGNFSDYYTHYKPAAALESVADPHNFVLSLMTQYGPLGLIGFLVMLLVPLWRSVAGSAQMTPTLPGPGPSSFKRLALVTLLSISVCLLLIRLLLIPLPQDIPAVQLYEFLTVHVAPLAAFLIGFLLIASPLDDAAGHGTDLWNRTSVAILGCTIPAVLLHNLVDYALFEPGVWMTFWILLACLIALRAQPRAEEEDGGHTYTFHSVAVGARVRKPLALGLAGVLLGLYLLGVWQPVDETAAAIQEAQHAAGAGDFETAHRRLQAATQADALSPVAANFNGRLYLQQYEQTRQKHLALLEEAVGCFTKAIERNPADYKNYEKLAQAYRELGQAEKAYEWYLKTAALYPGRERVWFDLAQTAEQMGKKGLALCHYAKAVEIEESYRQQFRQMYPDRQKVVSRLGDKEYQQAQKRIEELSK